MKMRMYKVTMKETYMEHPVEREAFCENEKEVIDFYGLNKPDIEWYKIESIEGSEKEF